MTHSHFSTSYTTHGLLFLFFRAPLSPFTPSRPICLFHGPVIHYSYRLGLMGFLSICQLFFVHVAGLLLSTWASKMAIVVGLFWLNCAGLPPTVLGPSILGMGVEIGPTTTQLGPACAQTIPRLLGARLWRVELFQMNYGRQI